METELEGRLLAMRQALAIAIALSTRSSPQATDMALELLGDLKANLDNTPADSPFGKPEWVVGARRTGRHRPAGPRLHADARTGRRSVANRASRRPAPAADLKRAGPLA